MVIRQVDDEMDYAMVEMDEVENSVEAAVGNTHLKAFIEDQTKISAECEYD